MLQMHINRFNNIMSKRKSEGKSLDLYSEMQVNFKKVDLAFFNTILNRLDKSKFDEEDFKKMKDSFPKPESNPHANSIPWGQKLVDEYIAQTEHPELVSEMKKFCEAKKMSYNKFRQFVNKYSDLCLERINPHRSTTEEQREEIESLLKEGVSGPVISQLTGVNYKLVNKIRNRLGVPGKKKRRTRKEIEEAKRKDKEAETVQVNDEQLTNEVEEVIKLESESNKVPEAKSWGELPTTLQEETHLETLESEPDSFVHFVSGPEAIQRLNTNFKEEIPEKIYESSDEFNKFRNEICEKYKTSKTQTEKFIRNKMKLRENRKVHETYQSLDNLIDIYKSDILNLIKDINERPTDPQFMQLDRLRNRLGILKDIKDLLQN